MGLKREVHLYLNKFYHFHFTKAVNISKCFRKIKALKYERRLSKIYIHRNSA